MKSAARLFGHLIDKRQENRSLKSNFLGPLYSSARLINKFHNRFAQDDICRPAPRSSEVADRVACFPFDCDDVVADLFVTELADRFC